MSRRYAADTEVSTEKSIAEIRGLIRRYGASEFAHMEGERQAAVLFTMRGRRIMFRLQMPDPTSRQFTHAKAGNQHQSVGMLPADKAYAKWEQACRSRWRALALAIKAKLEAVEVGIVEFETEFFGNIVMPGTNCTLAEVARDNLKLAYQNNAFTPLLEGPKP